MPVSLMTYVPDNTVFWGVVDIMQGNGNPGNTETGCQMPRIDRHLFNDVFS